MKAKDGNCRVWCENKIMKFDERLAIELDEDYDLETIQTAVEEALDELSADTDVFNNLVVDIYAQCSIEPAGYFDSDVVKKQLVKQAVEYVNSHGEIVVYAEFDEPIVEISQPIKIDVRAMLVGLVEDEYKNESIEQIAGREMYNAFCSFEELSRWHYALCLGDKYLEDAREWPKPQKTEKGLVWETDENCYQPIIWFGIDGRKPEWLWTLSKDMKYWEPEDWLGEDTMMAISGGDGMVDLWYCYECSGDQPDFSNIIATCPIQVTDDDSRESIAVKLDAFFIERYQMREQG